MTPNIGNQKNVVGLVPVLLGTLFVLACAEGSVTLTMLSDFADKGSMRCNSKVVLMCKVQPYSVAMTLEIDKKAAAECTYDSCKTFITEVGNYGFSFDTSKGIFNITLDPVTFAINGRTFKCDDGSDFAYINALVKVIPDNSATTVTSSKSSSFTEIKARTGCLHPSSSVTFEWYYFKDGDNPLLYMESLSSQATDEYGCTTGPCGGKGVVRVTSTLNIKEDPDGEEYYFQVLVKHPDTTDIIVRADKPFKLKRKIETEASSVTPVPVSSSAYSVHANRAGKTGLNLGAKMLSLFLTFYLL
ncbi:uncharacterized protein LOC123527738 [Mercenaria mercenaria]|uniref:uncharacterized protein LOC123527738 n=1 Tax=Mercenaria mercenaria TaxID=6596 RepID=UPI00234ED99B|nr:uncharacterized protein LOC123527738 [Mercenaria mercenaria]XP_053379917.1 uncharacterized protein LOC123527738 [Mercenaria mercenaria]XP_053379918.1 uncharacterized protein LOC123527738 [Mercenaria mercenaria]XP_053379919.1 uncharacterized protein LOC123527738 [Mercenaria mercenaria]